MSNRRGIVRIVIILLLVYALLCFARAGQTAAEMERKAAAAKGNDKVKYKYRSEHGALLRSQYVNLYNGGQFYLTKKNFAEAYKYFDMYILIRSNPIFDRPVKPKDSLQLIRAAYWATVCAWQTGERDKFLRYNRMALQDTVYRQKELELTARVAAAAKDTAAMVAALKSGVREYPMQDYFFTNLIDYYNGKGEFARALALSDSLLARDARSVMAQYGRSLVLLKMKRYDDCIAVAQSIVASDSTYAGAYYNIGAAYNFGMGVISADYEMTDFSTMQFRSAFDSYSDSFSAENEDIRQAYGKSHAMRLGFELKPMPEFAVRAGYSLTTVPDKVADQGAKNRQSASLGMGYSSGGSFFFDLALRGNFYPDEYHTLYGDNANPYGGNVLNPEVKITKNLWDIVATFGWRF